MGFLDKLFGNTSDKEVKRIWPLVDKILSYDEAMQKLSDDELKAMTPAFKERLANGETLDDILPEAFAVVREAASRVLGEKHYPVQLAGGIVLHQGRIAEMRTGEGKTLTSTCPVYLNALAGKGVHVVTVNDYLASRDSEWMGQVHRFLGLTVGCILNGMEPDDRRVAYNCDITYGTNNEFGFDYLRDNMVVYKEKLVQRDLHFAIIDEVDSVLIDEARTPLIISGRGVKSTDYYAQADFLAKRLQKGQVIGDTSKLAQMMQQAAEEEGDFIVDEKAKTVTLTADGVKKAEDFFKLQNLGDPENAEIAHHITIALKANYLMFRDHDYVVNDGQIVIVDEFTGRLMPGRRYSDGLHQAIEAKEGVEVKRESKTLATITFQNFFNKYEKKAGMTGTAKTEEAEFEAIYGMDVVEIPTNKPVQRIDHPDIVYATKEEKYRAAVRDIIECNQRHQPVLVGTITIEDSELVSKMLHKAGIKHNVLNAKYHEREAGIVAEAGQAGAVTIATNMAGRGTDIKLGEGVAELGGLKIIGTERHEARRIDNQLRGRSGRQGDPGESQFYVSMEDDLMRIFGGDRMKSLLETLRMPKDEPIIDKTFTSALERAQKRVEENNFGIRKHLLEYDQVMNEQRETIYAERRRVLEGEDLRDSMINMMDEYITDTVAYFTADQKHPETWDLNGMDYDIRRAIPTLQLDLNAMRAEGKKAEDMVDALEDKAHELYEAKEAEVNENLPVGMREFERIMLLNVVDALWMEHIDLMDQMRQGISLQAMANRNPLDEYRIAAFDMFDDMNTSIQEKTLHAIFAFHFRANEEVQRHDMTKNMVSNHADTSATAKPVKRAVVKVGRNDPCPCGSGLKYKNCCGKNS